MTAQSRDYDALKGVSSEVPKSKISGVLRLVTVIISLAAIWAVALPWVAGRPRVARQLKWLDDQGIDPSAMYYTELEAMKPILKKLYDDDLTSH